MDLWLSVMASFQTTASREHKVTARNLRCELNHLCTPVDLSSILVKDGVSLLTHSSMNEIYYGIR